MNSSAGFFSKIFAIFRGKALKNCYSFFFTTVIETKRRVGYQIVQKQWKQVSEWYEINSVRNCASKKWYFVYEKDKRGHFHACKGYFSSLKEIKIKNTCIC